MRLRYLHLPRYGPLDDTAVVFGREERIRPFLVPPRKGTLNFVVGVNGSGKSSILRILYRTFRALNLLELPPVPLTLAWDKEDGSDPRTTVLHYSNKPDERSFLAMIPEVPGSAGRIEWAEMRDAIGAEEDHPLAHTREVEFGPDALRGSLLFARLPKRLIAYTSGAAGPWDRLDDPELHPKDEDEGQYRSEDERPQGWTMDREWEEEQPIRITNILTRTTLKISGTAETTPGGGQVGELPPEAMAQLTQEFAPLNEIRRKVAMNRTPRSERVQDFYFRIRHHQLRYAGIAMALWQTATELAGQNTEADRDGLRRNLRNPAAPIQDQTTARRALNDIDWFFPTHLSITYRDADDRVSPLQHEELLCLVALADEVIAQPRGRHRAVISLGPTRSLNLTEKLKEASPLGVSSREVEETAGRVDGCKTGAEAVLRLFCKDLGLDSTPLDFFARLRDWERTGLLEDVTLTVKRLRRTGTQDDGEESDESDDVIVTFDQLSDGEQMLLGRIGLLFLLRGQDGALLLLDEPETHFNDVWKRDIVDMVDSGLLNSTEANVIIATHTTIALTDAFGAEVTVLDRSLRTGVTTARGVKGGLFGTDPGEVNMNLFHAESSIGRRSLKILNRLLEEDWKGKESELEGILEVLGSSFHRAELRAILKQLRATTDGAASP
ncbi:AAA family ATPase [Luteolibacter sp. Populi]|uniref:AAA family ATPase n=1 Tax=Luteolibacter sp. Populi TaxID=3230487 RepID=UPI003465CFDE